MGSLNTGIAALFLVMTATAACKSRYEFTGNKKEGASTTKDDTSPFIPGSGDSTSGGTPTGSSGSSSTGTTSTSTPTPNPTPTSNPSPNPPTNPPIKPDTIPTPTTANGPIAGIEVVQNGVVVTTITAGVPVTFRPTSWTRDTDNSGGCANPGIIQAVWFVGSQLVKDIRRSSLTDCRDLVAGGTFTRAATVLIVLDVLTDEGEGTNAQAYYNVVDPNGTKGSTGPTQK